MKSICQVLVMFLIKARNKRKCEQWNTRGEGLGRRKVLRWGFGEEISQRCEQSFH